MGQDIHIRTFLVGIAEGNMDAFGELYNMISIRVFNYARAITNNKEMAEDITHDVFLQLLKKAPRLAKMANPIAYIMIATRNHSFDYLRRSKRTSVSLEDISESSTVPMTYDRLLIEDAFSKLPANQRETVYLYHICGFTQREVSQIMDVPLVTVKWRCGKALSQLQAYFTHIEEDDSSEVTRHNNT